MEHLRYEQIDAACRPGGASVLTVRTDLQPAGGREAGVAPARYVRKVGGRDEATYAFETRFGTPLGESEPRAVKVVVINSKGASLNKVEEPLSQAIKDGHALLSLTPRIQVTYPGSDPVLDFDLPGRGTDGHVRAGSVDGKPVTEHPAYRRFRDATAANLRAVLEMSPISATLGAWDSTRKNRQLRLRSVLVGETIGILADQSTHAVDVPRRGAARSDLLAPSVRLNAPDMRALLNAQRSELSPGNVKNIETEIAKSSKRDATSSAAPLGLGSIPPSLEGLGFVSCQQVLRTHVLSFSALRQLRFGLGVDGDASARALLAVLALNGLARADDELVYRANCDLVEAGPASVELDGRHGRRIALAPLEIEAADVLLAEAIDRARAAGIRWEGQVFEVTGNPLVAGGILGDADEG